MANAFYNRGASFNPDELADGDAIEAEFDSVSRGFDTIEDLVDLNKAGYPSQTFHVAPATETTHAVQKAQLDSGLAPKLNAAGYNAADVLSKLKTVDGTNSGLDADLLDGQEGSYYRNASNINNGTLAKERLPASIDASTSGNAATASKVSGTAPDGGTADLVSGAMAGSDFFRIRIGGSTDAGWTEIATADNGTEPIYVRQYTGDFVSVARTATLLDGSGNTSFPGTVSATTFSGNASTAATLQTARTINSISFNGSANITVEPYIELDATAATRYVTFVDSGTAGYQRLNIDGGLTYNPSTNILGASISGNAGTATTLQNTRTINGVSFNGSANVTVEPYVELDTGTAATRYITFVDSSTAGYQRHNIDTELTYNPSTNVLGATISGNAGTATKLQTARTLALSGDVTGSVSFDGSGNATIAAELSDTGVLASCATAGAGAVGSYAFAVVKQNAVLVAFGETKAGADLTSSNAANNMGTILAGTWRCMGRVGTATTYTGAATTLWLRIS